MSVFAYSGRTSTWTYSGRSPPFCRCFPLKEPRAAIVPTFRQGDTRALQIHFPPRLCPLTLPENHVAATPLPFVVTRSSPLCPAVLLSVRPLSCISFLSSCRSSAPISSSRLPSQPHPLFAAVPSLLCPVRSSPGMSCTAGYKLHIAILSQLLAALMAPARFGLQLSRLGGKEKDGGTSGDDSWREEDGKGSGANQERG